MKKLLFVCAVLLSTVAMACAQVSSIDSVVVNLREFNDIPSATAVAVWSYPSFIEFYESGVSNPQGGFANRDVWRFSGNGGVTPYQFGNDDFFDVFMELRLDTGTISPRKEAGFLLDTIGGQGQFIVNTDAHEVVAFGGPLPFYSFAPLQYNAGDTLRMGMTYFLDPNTNLRSVIYHAGALSSPVLPLTNLEQGIIDGSTLGGYLQIVNDPSNPNNGGIARFENIRIGAPGLVPEPATFALTALGLAAAAGLRRRRG